MWIKNSDDRNEQEPLTVLTALGLGQTMFGFAVRTLKARRKLASLFLYERQRQPERIRYSCHGKGEGQYVGVGEKDIGCASCSSWA
jgi:hypothetical protein